MCVLTMCIRRVIRKSRDGMHALLVRCTHASVSDHGNTRSSCPPRRRRHCFHETWRDRHGEPYDHNISQKIPAYHGMLLNEEQGKILTMAFLGTPTHRGRRCRLTVCGELEVR